MTSSGLLIKFLLSFSISTEKDKPELRMSDRPLSKVVKGSRTICELAYALITTKNRAQNCLLGAIASPKAA